MCGTRNAFERTYVWNCVDCGLHSLGALTAIVGTETKNNCIRICPGIYQVAETRGHCTKYSSVVQRTTQNKNTYSPENKIFGFELAGQSNAPKYSSKRHKPDDENDDDAMNTADFPARMKTTRPRRQNFGTKQSHDDFNVSRKT